MQRRSRGVLFALASALLFGVGVPMAKALVGKADPVLLAGLLYLGSGIGLSAWRWARRLMAPAARFEPGVKGADLGWLAGALGLDGIAAPQSGRCVHRQLSLAGIQGEFRSPPAGGDAVHHRRRCSAVAGRLAPSPAGGRRQPGRPGGLSGLGD